VKQWALKPEELAASVTGRVPIHISYDDRYFQDIYQAMPLHGYSRLFESILDHPNITLMLGADYRELPPSVSYKRMLYTGAIDAFFDYAHGVLPYRSLRFEFQTLEQEEYQPVAQVNYPNTQEYTRIAEYKHATGQTGPRTTIIREYPQAYEIGKNDAFYPIPKDEYRAIFEKYKEEAKKLNGSVVFSGRLADYQYYNMDQVVARALVVFDQEVADVKRLRDSGDAQPRTLAA
jgi:UDP-galactopyranose mutase